MSLFNWSDKFLTGISEIDRQHKKIVDIINDLNDLRNKDENNENLHEIINEMVFYTKTHLLYEENLLKQHEYPDFSSHKSEHDKLIKEVRDLQTKFFTGDTTLSTDIAILLNDWLSEHILVNDKKYVLFLKNKGATCVDRMETVK